MSLQAIFSDGDPGLLSVQPNFLTNHDEVFPLDRSHSGSPWLNPLLIPAYLSLLSVLILISQFTWSLLDKREHQFEQDEWTPINVDDLKAEFTQHVNRRGGFAIVIWKTLRLLSCLALVGLTIAIIVIEKEADSPSTSPPNIGFLDVLKKRRRRKDGKAIFTEAEWHQIILGFVFIYTSLLSALSLSATLKRARQASIHLVLLLIATFILYAYRDIWPLATYTLKPVDHAEGNLLWGRIYLLAFAAVIIPLLIPRRYIPLDPQNPQVQANAEQTSCLLSFLSYTFLDSIIAYGYRHPRVPYDKLPPLCDYDRAEYLTEKTFETLDPYRHKKQRYLFWSLMRVFWKEYAEMTLMITIRSVAGFAAPLTINRLLAYIESGGENAFVRPWVWIVGMFLGPVVGAIAIQYYIFVATGSLVRVGAIFTQLVFEHSLRIRLVDKPEVSNSRGSSKVPSGASTPFESEEAPAKKGGASSSAQSEDASTTSSTVAESHRKATGVATVPLSSSSSTATEIAPPAADVKSDNMVGKINNLITVDTENVIDGRDFLFLIWGTPLEMVITTFFLYRILDWSALVGIATLLIVFPIPGYLARLVNDVQDQRMKRTDARTQGVTEVMSVLRMIKLFAWEKRMHERLGRQRDLELKWVKYRQLLQLCISTCNYTIPLFALITTYGSYTLFLGRELNASVVFSSIALFDMMKERLHGTFYFLPMIAQAKISLDRIDDFLKNSELLDEFKPSSGNINANFMSSMAPSSEGLIGFSDATFSWSDEEQPGSRTPSRRFRLHIDGELYFMKDKINLVVGPTGSGKTSMLHALLGEMHFLPTGPGSRFSLPRGGGVAYAAQESWVQNETIKDNILFGSPMIRERYDKVLYQCGLKEDLRLFEAADETEVGEKGLTLSGGQKARITLARAIYSQASILLLDDVLAALDVHTARWITEKCFQGDLIKDRTVILVTHNVTLASPIADYVVSLGLDGRVVSRGSMDEALRQNSSLRQDVKRVQDLVEKEQQAVDSAGLEAKLPQSSGKLIVAEEIAEGHVAWPALKMYLLAFGGSWLWIVVALGCIGASICGTLQPWYLGEWARQYEHRPAADISIAYYLGIYTLIILGSVVFWLTAFVTFFLGGVQASRKIYSRLTESILGTTMRWLDVVPTSRVITRCTQDIRAVDGPLPNQLADIFDLVSYMLFRLVGVVAVTPIFLVPGLLVGVFGAWCGQLYIQSQLSVKREMSNARAPVLGHFGAAINGLVSLRAYGAQAAFRRESIRRVNNYTQCGRTFYNLNRWISIRIDSLGALFASALGAYLVYGHPTVDASGIGFSLSMAVSFSGSILWLVRIYNDFEIQGNSLERILDYMEIEQEPTATEGGQPPAYWPASGNLRVTDLCAKYSVDGPEVLHSLNFSIRSGEHIGVVGRTGSGKSSLALSLLRCIFTTGTVFYDDKDTSRLNLEALRSSITIIPQQPELLTGSLRQNLDPFEQADDATLNSALSSAGLFSLQEEEDEARLALDSTIASGGSNLSVGQRQIVALARALIRQSKLLILDEATSAIDHKTDNIIQTSIRKELQGVTLITIAHRLQSIMDADRIMVLKAGNIVEYDTPENLLKNTDGLFYSLVNESTDRDKLIDMAQVKIRNV